ncbi:MAG: Minor structural protein [Herbinix sp.]|jgi:predicted RNase H-like nuclease (RuvC/YqgF family)|nr:Minor structural protein [Herbinix sp.]
MEWLKVLLEKATITDGKLDIDALMKSIKEEFPKNAVPKSEFNTLNDTKKDLEQQIKDRDKQLKDLGEKVKGNEEAEKTIKNLQEANKKTKDEYEAKVKELKLDAAIQAKLSEAKYPELMIGRIDKTKLSISEDGTILGIDEQVAKLKEIYKDQFKPAVTGNDPYNKDKPAYTGKNPWKKESFNLTEQGKLLKEQPDLAKQLMAQAK